MSGYDDGGDGGGTQRRRRMSWAVGIEIAPMAVPRSKMYEIHNCPVWKYGIIEEIESMNGS